MSNNEAKPQTKGVGQGRTNQDQGRLMLLLCAFALCLLLADMLPGARVKSDFIDASLLAHTAAMAASACQTPPVLAPFFAQPMNINQADQQRLEMLPGIGPRLAARIIAQRSQQGGFQSISDLARVRGIGPKMLAKLERLVCVP